jgi:hypothetical protein
MEITEAQALRISSRIAAYLAGYWSVPLDVAIRVNRPDPEIIDAWLDAFRAEGISPRKE